MTILRCFRTSIAVVLVAVALPSAASEFFSESSGTLTTRNYYLDRDYKGSTQTSAAREWAQGFIFRANSGYTEGPVGFGLDVAGFAGVQLDSSSDRTGTGLLAYDPVTRDAQHEFGEFGITGKATVSETRLAFGTIQPQTPVVFGSPARLLPQTFRGVSVNSREIPKLAIEAAYIDQVNQRDSSGYEDMVLAAPNGRFRPGTTSDRLVYGGADYELRSNLIFKYYRAQLEDVYEQDYLGLLHIGDLPVGKLKTDLRFFDSREDGRALGGAVDNRYIGGMFTWLVGRHGIGAGYMELHGDTALPYLGGGEPMVHSEGTMSSDFMNPNERTWLVRYDYNFGDWGLPGLNVTARYLRGSDIDLPALGGRSLNESSKDFELAYAVQSGALKGLGLKLRTNFYRNDLSSAASFRDANETRVNFDYTWTLW